MSPKEFYLNSNPVFERSKVNKWRMNIMHSSIIGFGKRLKECNKKRKYFTDVPTLAVALADALLFRRSK